jgi:membrane-associated protease RseP (regulator of RpoE activity)
MKKIILLSLAIGLSNTLLVAQDLSTCKNPCTKNKTIEEGAFLGVRIVTGEGCQYAKVLEVIPNTAASKNNIEVNDIITTIDGETILNNQHIIQVIKAHQPNDVVKVTYFHNNKSVVKKIALGALVTRVVTETVCCDEPIIGNSKSENATAIATNIKLNIFPNPAANTLQIISDKALLGETTVSILDINGSEVLNKTFSSEGAMNYKLDISTIANGNYIVKIMNSNFNASRKLVIAK